MARAWDKAATYLRRAADKAVGRSACLEALTHCELALDALKHLPDSRTQAEQTVDILIEIRQPRLALGEWRRESDLLHEAEAIARRIEDQRRTTQASYLIANARWRAGDYEGAQRYGHLALDVAQISGDRALIVNSNYHLGYVYHALAGCGKRIFGPLRRRCAHRKSKLFAVRVRHERHYNYVFQQPVRGCRTGGTTWTLQRRTCAKP
jgi:predicted ATPase